MKTRIYLCVSLTILLMVLPNVNGQTDITPKTIFINLTVESPNAALKNRVRAAFLAELKKTPDLELVDDRYVFGLEVVAYDIRTSTGLNFGFAMSTITTSIVACQDILNTKDLKYRVDRHALTLTDNARLGSEVQAIVADFNKRIDPVRKVKVTILN